MSFDKLKILTLKKPLSLKQEAQMFTTFGKKQPYLKTPPQSAKKEPSLEGQKEKISKSSSDPKAARRELQKQRHERQKKAIAWLTQTFPACFNLHHPQPLKIGLVKDLIEFSKAQEDRTQIPSHLSLRKTLNFYTQRRQYLQAILSAPHRYDLDGKAAQEITPEQRDHAQARLEQLEKRHQKGQKQRPVSSPSENLP